MANPYSYTAHMVSLSATISKVLSTLTGVAVNPTFPPNDIQYGPSPAVAYTDKPFLLNYWLGVNGSVAGGMTIDLTKLAGVSVNPAGAGSVQNCTAGPALDAEDVNVWWENSSYTNGAGAAATVYLNGVLYVSGVGTDLLEKPCEGILATPIPFGSSGVLSPTPIGAAEPVGQCNSFIPTQPLNANVTGILTWGGKTQIIMDATTTGGFVLSDESGNITQVTGVWPGVDTVNTTGIYFANTDGTSNYFVAPSPGSPDNSDPAPHLWAIRTSATTGALENALKLSFSGGEEVLWGYPTPQGFVYFLDDGTASIIQLAFNGTYERIEFSTLPASEDPTSYLLGGFSSSGSNAGATGWGDSGPAMYDTASGKWVVVGGTPETMALGAVLVG